MKKQWRTLSQDSPYFIAIADRPIMETGNSKGEAQWTEAARQSSVVTIFAVWNTMMGTSLLAMPWGIERAGLLMGPLLTIFVGALCLYTAYCNLRAHRQFGTASGDVSELTRTLLGPVSEIIAKTFSLIVLMGANIVYWILMTNFLFHSINYLNDMMLDLSVESHTNNSSSSLSGVFCPLKNPVENVTVQSTNLFQQIWNIEMTVPIFLAVLIFPLLNFKSPTFFTKFNSLGTMSVMYLILFVLVKSGMWGVNLSLDPKSFHFSPLIVSSFPATSGMLALSFFIHNIIITIMRSNAEQKNNGRDLTIAYGLVTMTYLLIGAVFYIAFPLEKSCIRDNFLNNFASWDLMTVIARVFLLFQLVTVFPLISFMLRSQTMVAITGNPFPSRLYVLIFNIAIVAICIIFAIFLPKIGTIIRFTGALSGLVHVFTIPCMLRLASLYKNDKISIGSWILYLSIPIFGGVNLLGQFFVTD
ncbi:sodium-coupled neutral amino acid transporter 9 homolog isoform X2 [Cimex lectularius]|uniref:Amino acid transporter transmembrane domain-containing protein n=1 Tax=Cimex lectularius TaxID=79782 RepID=A0A8I6R6Q6_CIMLE|nr:sodium-coupled neutral amino acid transporter 9 homolog isoform X2 [Cimex lectularius]